MRLHRPSMAQVTILVFLGAILISEGMLYAPPAEEHLSFDIHLSYANGYVNESEQVSSTYTASFVRTNLVETRATPVTTIYFYYDSVYPASWATPQNWYGLSQHLGAVASQRPGTLTVTYVNASELRSLLLSPPSPGSALLVASGVLPYTVFSKTQNLVLPWMRDGGVLIWAGAMIGAFSGLPGQPLHYPSPENPGTAGTGEFLNLNLLGANAVWFLNQTATSEALGLNFSYGETGDELNISLVGSEGGVPLGPAADGYTNLAILPEGAGRLVYFGAPVNGLDQLSQTILNGLASGAFLGNFSVLATHAFTIESGQSVTFTESLHVAPWVGAAPFPQQDCVFAYQSDFVGFFAANQCLALPYG